MRFFSVLALSGLVAAEASLYQRQVSTLVGVVNQVNDATGKLDTAIKAFNGASDVQGLQQASDNLASIVQKGVQTVNGATTISLTDAVTIQGQVQNLQASVEGVVNDLISKKSTIDAAGAGAAVSKNLNDQLTGAKALSAAIASKVPSEVQTLAQQLSAGIASALQKGVDAYKGDTTSGAATSGSGSGSSSGSSSSGSSSSGSSSSGSSSGSSGAGASSGSAATKASSGSAAVSTSASPKPATFTGAAAPRAVAGSLAGAIAVGVAAIAL